MSTTHQQPDYTVFAVSKGEKTSFWREIGAAWKHRNGDGLNLRLDLLPLNGAEIVLRKPKPKAKTGEGQP